MRQARNADGTQFGAGIADVITVELHNPDDYQVVIATFSDVELGVNGSATITVPSSLSNSYFITIKHRNSIETTSASPVSFEPSNIQYSFSSNSSMAYGNNEKNLSQGYFGLFSGDINSDGIVDSADMAMLDNPSWIFTFGYVVEDLTGNGIVDAADMSLLDNNSGQLVMAQLPSQSTPPENSVYIDPTFSGSNQDGSISRPFNSWTKFALQNGYNYFQKRGTTYSSGTQISVSSKSDIRIGAYGTGARPIFSYTGSGYAFYVNQSSSITIENFEVNGNGSAFSLVSVMGSSGSYTNSNVINNCLLHNSHNTNNGGFGVYGFYNNNLKVLNTEIHNIALDGMYLKYNPGVEIGYTHIHDINRRYFLNSNQTASSGDGIQLDGNYNGFHIHHSNIDRTNGAGNKFNVILNSAPGLSDGASGIIEYNTFTTDSTVSTALHIERGNGIITRYNTFKGVTQGLRIGGGYTSNNLIHNNLFYNCTSGIGIGYSYPSGGPAINTKVYNNVFYHVTSKHIWVDQTNVVAKNNIHVRTNDSGVSLYNYGGGSWSISDNCYSSAAVAGTPGTGTNPVIGNPLFVNPSAFNFHLQSGSPCIDSGSSVGILKDFDQISIPQNGVPDIGAFEYH